MCVFPVRGVWSISLRVVSCLGYFDWVLDEVGVVGRKACMYFTFQLVFVYLLRC